MCYLFSGVSELKYYKISYSSGKEWISSGCKVFNDIQLINYIKSNWLLLRRSLLLTLIINLFVTNLLHSISFLLNFIWNLSICRLLLLVFIYNYFLLKSHRFFFLVYSIFIEKSNIIKKRKFGFNQLLKKIIIDNNLKNCYIYYAQ